jgi:hypothetical protein
MSKKNIEEVLPSREQYVVTTSEFNQIKAQLAQLENRRPSPEEANKPSLRRKTQRPDVNNPDDTSTSSKTSSKDKTDTQADSTKPEDKEPADDDRPKLKRRN